jgi:hypothetical protein
MRPGQAWVRSSFGSDDIVASHELHGWTAALTDPVAAGQHITGTFEPRQVSSSFDRIQAIPREPSMKQPDRLLGRILIVYPAIRWQPSDS